MSCRKKGRVMSPNLLTPLATLQVLCFRASVQSLYSEGAIVCVRIHVLFVDAEMVCYFGAENCLKNGHYELLGGRACLIAMRASHARCALDALINRIFYATGIGWHVQLVLIKPS
jgi:hypothetical protein